MKRINEATGQPFKRGDVREDGRIFFKYKTDRIKKTGYFEEKWNSPERFKYNTNRVLFLNVGYKKRKRSTLEGYLTERISYIKKRAEKSGLPFDLDVEYLMSIYVEKCPALLLDLDWCNIEGPAKDNTPSLDKIKPELGYVKGNVQWLSRKANTMKSNANETELNNFAKWILNETK